MMGCVHLVETNLVKLVYGHGNVDNLVGLTNDLSNAREDLAVVDLYLHTNAETCKHGIDDLHQLHLVEQRVAAHHVGITLVELAITAFLRAVSTPHGLYLVTLERHLQLVAVHHDVTCEGNGHVVTQPLLADL